MKASKKKTIGFSDEEKAAMKERAQEISGKGEGESAVLARISGMPEPDRTMAKKIHVIVMKNAPSLKPKTWYGMPAYANKDGKVVCYFQDANKFKARYATFGFNDFAKLDEGNMWATSFAVKKLTGKEEKMIAEFVKKAVA